MPRNIIFFRAKFSWPENDHPSCARIFQSRAIRWCAASVSLKQWPACSAREFGSTWCSEVEPYIRRRATLPAPRRVGVDGQSSKWCGSDACRALHPSAPTRWAAGRPHCTSPVQASDSDSSSLRVSMGSACPCACACLVHKARLGRRQRIASVRDAALYAGNLFDLNKSGNIKKEYLYHKYIIRKQGRSRYALWASTNLCGSSFPETAL
jgi:hypothetical protein